MITGTGLLHSVFGLRHCYLVLDATVPSLWPSTTHHYYSPLPTPQHSLNTHHSYSLLCTRPLPLAARCPLPGLRHFLPVIEPWVALTTRHADDSLQTQDWVQVESRLMNLSLLCWCLIRPLARGEPHCVKYLTRWTPFKPVKFIVKIY